jgi:hypothetical protein
MVAALVESAQQQMKVMQIKDRKGAAQVALVKAAEGAVAALNAFAAAAGRSVRHEDGQSQPSRKAVGNLAQPSALSSPKTSSGTEVRSSTK